MGSSPLTRGKLIVKTHAAGAQRLIPAHAGKTTQGRRVMDTTAAHPRSRGENCRPSRRAVTTGGSSPLTRGKRTHSSARPTRVRLIPAHAGKTPRREAAALSRSAHPRSRGENLAMGSNACVAGGSSPLTRGKPPLRPLAHRRIRLIPAHAGKTYTALKPTGLIEAHPRSRGENALARLGRGGMRWLIPAHAGKTPWRMLLRLGRWAHPRSRGENLGPSFVGCSRTGSSPLTRGKQWSGCSLCVSFGLIPAHAGKTSRRCRRVSPRRAHPRSRGENLLRWWASALKPGSSPLTRGKRACGF